MRRYVPAVVASMLALAAVAGVAEQQPQRDLTGAPRSVPAGSALVSGTILSDDPSPQPLRGVRVTVSSADFNVNRTVTTDDAGRFAISALPGNRYTLSASKPGWVRMAYGAKRYDRPGTPITLANDQQMTGVTMRLSRGSVITGVVTDETGMPAFGVSVRAMQYRLQAGGERQLVNAGIAGSVTTDQTDDRGMYRLYGMPAGEYVIAAQPRLMTTGDVRAMTEGEMRAALAAVQQTAAGRAPAPGTGGEAQQQAPSNAEDVVTVGYAPVYHPSTTSAVNSTAVTVGSGDERTGVDLRLQVVRTAKIQGMVVTPPGVSPQSVQLTLLPSGSMATSSLATVINRAPVGPDGKFSYSGIPPGQYTITGRSGGRSNVMSIGGANETMMFTTELRAAAVAGVAAGAGAGAMGAPPPDPGPQLWGLTDVNVDGQNLNNVAVTMQPGMTLSGRLAFDGTKMAAPTDLSRARVTLTPALTAAGGVIMNVPSAEVDASGTFRITGIAPGRYRLTANTVVTPGALGTWNLRSAVAAGRDALDFPIEIKPNEEISDAVITFTDVTQEVSGMLQDPAGRAAPDFTIIVFASDNRYWTSPSRRIRTTRPGTDGRFTVTGLPAGQYRIAAVTDLAQNEANDPAFLEQLLKASYEFTLAQGEKKVQDLRISGQ